MIRDDVSTLIFLLEVLAMVTSSICTFIVWIKGSGRRTAVRLVGDGERNTQHMENTPDWWTQIMRESVS